MTKTGQKVDGNIQVFIADLSVLQFTCGFSIVEVDLSKAQNRPVGRLRVGGTIGTLRTIFAAAIVIMDGIVAQHRARNAAPITIGRVSGILLVTLLRVALRNLRRWIRLTKGCQRTTSTIAPNRAVRKEGRAKEAHVTVDVFTHEGVPAQELAVILSVGHVAGAANTNGEAIATEERLSELRTDMHTLPRIDDMSKVLVGTLQVVVVAFADDELFVGRLSHAPRVADIAPFVIEGEEVVIAQRVAAVEESICAMLGSLIHDCLGVGLALREHLLDGWVSLGLSRSGAFFLPVAIEVVTDRRHILLPGGLVEKHTT